MRSKIESLIAGKNMSNPLLNYSSPPSRVYDDGLTWILLSTQGCATMKQAQNKIDEIDTDPMSSIGENRVIVSWKPPYRRTSKYYIYWRQNN